MTNGQLEKEAEVYKYRLGMSSLGSVFANHIVKFISQGTRQAGTTMHNAAGRLSHSLMTITHHTN